ncbi:MAG: hypothetical protein OEW67_01100 [Cyclobacteriaceae bacterium]|nr:hypothetical protein [Cyclobacteriaceae bacterium]
MKVINLNHTESDSVKNSLRNIYALFLSKDTIKPQYITCVIKWGLQMQLNYEEINDIIENVDENSFEASSDKLESIQRIYDLVHLIYLDDKIEDIELEVATKYAEALGYEPHVVGDILKTILTAPYDGLSDDEIRDEIKSLVKMNLL